MKSITTLVVASLVISQALAQSASSFQLVTGVTGLTASRSGNALTVAAGATPQFFLGSNQYTITSIFGAWLVDYTDDLSATGGVQNGFSYHDNYAGMGGIAGWKTNPNLGFVNDTKVFNYTSVTGTEEGIGFHVRVAEMLPDGSDTLYIIGAPVPEPASMTALAVGALALLRRRKAR